jgi:hypothetical protein
MPDDRPATNGPEEGLVALAKTDPKLAKAVIDRFTQAFVTAASLSSTARARAAGMVVFSVEKQHQMLHATSTDSRSTWEEHWDGSKAAALKFAERIGSECAGLIMRERARDGSTHWDV